MIGRSRMRFPVVKHEGGDGGIGLGAGELWNLGGKLSCTRAKARSGSAGAPFCFGPQTNHCACSPQAKQLRDGLN